MLSLRSRLLLGFTLLTLMCWTLAAVGAWYQTREKINALFDTQQMLFAKRLTTLPDSALSGTPLTLPKSKHLLHHHRGEQDDDVLAFAIFTRDGRMVLNDGDNGRRFRFDDQREGFRDGQLADDDDPWRFVWLTSANRRYVVAVGQEWEARDDMTRDIVISNLQPWLYATPLMLALLFWLVTHQLAPLKRLTRTLRQRAPDDGAPLATAALPTEIRPTVDALNQLFARTDDLLQRERRFTSDAAHELRSPLAALKVQSEVLQLADENPALRQHALTQLHTGIDRATRLVDQLLTLARLDDTQPNSERQHIDLLALTRQQLADHYSVAQAADVSLTLQAPDRPVMRQGYPLLLGLLLRNLLDNAIRYGRPGGTITVSLQPQGWQICDDGPGVDPAALTRLGERFWRPPGQQKTGSGLGLSIVMQIAALHGMRVSFSNRAGGGFCVTVRG